MSTAANIDRGVKAGFAAIKEKMVVMAEDIKKLQEREKTAREEKEAARNRGRAALVKMSELTMLSGEKEEILRKKTEKLQYSLQRLDERQGHLARLGEWNKSISQVPEEKLKQMEEEVLTTKKAFNATKQKLGAARSRASELEEKIEKIESKNNEYVRKDDQIRVQFVHQNKEFELKQKREKQQVDAARDVEEKYHQLEQEYYNARRRHDTASVALKELEVKLSQTELICDELKKKRTAMESTLRELLSSYSKGREVRPPPKYPEAGTAVNSSSK